jgi:hypothetical protein
MQSQKESRLFLQKLLQNPPTLPFEPKLLPLLFAVTQEGSNASVRSVVALIEKAHGSQHVCSQWPIRLHMGLNSRFLPCKEPSASWACAKCACLCSWWACRRLYARPSFPRVLILLHSGNTCFFVATIARTLADVLGGDNGVCGASACAGERLVMVPDEAYIAGLLHDVGKIFCCRTPRPLGKDGRNGTGRKLRQF